jgi:hypothetical protein
VTLHLALIDELGLGRATKSRQTKLAMRVLREKPLAKADDRRIEYRPLARSPRRSSRSPGSLDTEAPKRPLATAVRAVFAISSRSRSANVNSLGVFSQRC